MGTARRCGAGGRRGVGGRCAFQGGGWGGAPRAAHQLEGVKKQQDEVAPRREPLAHVDERVGALFRGAGRARQGGKGRRGRGRAVRGMARGRLQPAGLQGADGGQRSGGRGPKRAPDTAAAAAASSTAQPPHSRAAARPAAPLAPTNALLLARQHARRVDDCDLLQQLGGALGALEAREEPWRRRRRGGGGVRSRVRSRAHASRRRRAAPAAPPQAHGMRACVGASPRSIQLACAAPCRQSPATQAAAAGPKTRPPMPMPRPRRPRTPPTRAKAGEALIGLVRLHRQRVAGRAALLQAMVHHHEPGGGVARRAGRKRGRGWEARQAHGERRGFPRARRRRGASLPAHLSVVGSGPMCAPG
jgi:hypothetical protein